MKSCVTIALVPSIKSGPWIYWNDLDVSLQKAAGLGFDAVELFTASAEALDPNAGKRSCKANGLTVGAVGTGAGKVLHGLTLTDPDPSVRRAAAGFIRDMIAFGAVLNAPAIIGSMQGNAVGSVTHPQALDWLAEGLNELGAFAETQGVFLIYEPLNRYETNLINRLADGVDLLNGLTTRNVRLLADLFHMSIEEASLPESIRVAGKAIGHVHFADSNRRPVGGGHTDMKPIIEALREIEYEGCLSAEAFPWPNPDEAAEQTIRAFRSCIR